jgi:hypothetical protein
MQLVLVAVKFGKKYQIGQTENRRVLVTEYRDKKEYRIIRIQDKKEMPRQVPGHSVRQA